MGAAENLEERCLTLAEVCSIVSRKKTWVYERIALGEFPAADEGRWYYSEVMAYLAQRRESRGVAGKVVGKIARNAANS